MWLCEMWFKLKLWAVCVVSIVVEERMKEFTLSWRFLCAAAGCDGWRSQGLPSDFLLSHCTCEGDDETSNRVTTRL